jgi:hypothetical protein
MPVFSVRTYEKKALIVIVNWKKKTYIVYIKFLDKILILILFRRSHFFFSTTYSFLMWPYLFIISWFSP